MKLSIIVPFKSNEHYRLKSYEWNMARWKAWYPEGEVISVSKSETPFNRSAVRNFGAQSASNELLVFADADTFVQSKKSLDLLCELVADREIPWGLPYDVYFNANQECTSYLLKQHEEDYEPSEDEISYDHRLTDSISGVYVVRKQDWVPMDERFLGWGFEDRAQQMTLDTIVGPHFRIKDSFVVHCWHPAPESECFGQPNIIQNRKLNNRYEAAQGDRQRMLDLIGER